MFKLVSEDKQRKSAVLLLFYFNYCVLLPVLVLGFVSL